MRLFCERNIQIPSILPVIEYKTGICTVKFEFSQKATKFDLKFRYCENTTKFEKVSIFLKLLSNVNPKWVFQIFVAFSKNLNFNLPLEFDVY